MEFPALVTLAALLEYMFFSFQVGVGRGKFDVPAPAVSGNPEWERYFRVQQNTLEQLMVFLPSLWIFAYFLNPLIAAGIGVLFIIGRAIYYVSYIKEPASRSLGFLLGFISINLLLLGALGGVIYNFV